MKTPFTLIAFMLVFTSNVHTQNADTLTKTRYGLELSQFISGSGFASGTELFFTVISNDRRTLSLGVFFCSEQKKISGVTVHHEVAVVRFPSQKKVVPFVFYNMIYRFTRTGITLPGNEEMTNYGLYKSIENHLGMGASIRIAHNFHIKGSLGYGVYFGSIKKPTVVNSLTGEIGGSNGFSPLGKIGIVLIL